MLLSQMHRIRSDQKSDHMQRLVCVEQQFTANRAVRQDTESTVFQRHSAFRLIMQPYSDYES